MNAYSFTKLFESTDDAYMQAVDSGDMETAQRMVDEAARKSGYSTRGFHGTVKRWTTYLFGKRATLAPDEAVYITDSNEEATIAASPSRSKAIVMELFTKTYNPLVIDARGTQKDRSFGKAGYKKAIEIAKAKGHDSVVVKNVVDYGDSSQTTTILFSPDQIKSADPVTYDDQGEVIPLSQRFNYSSNDIRY